MELDLQSLRTMTSMYIESLRTSLRTASNALLALTGE